MRKPRHREVEDLSQRHTGSVSYYLSCYARVSLIPPWASGCVLAGEGTILARVPFSDFST